jgi:hypothetical protein
LKTINLAISTTQTVTDKPFTLKIPDFLFRDVRMNVNLEGMSRPNGNPIFPRGISTFIINPKTLYELKLIRYGKA